MKMSAVEVRGRGRDRDRGSFRGRFFPRGFFFGVANTDRGEKVDRGATATAAAVPRGTRPRAHLCCRSHIMVICMIFFISYF